MMETYSYPHIAKHYLGYSISQLNQIEAARDPKNRTMKNLGYLSRGLLKTAWVLRNQTIRGMPMNVDELLADTPVRPPGKPRGEDECLALTQEVVDATLEITHALRQ